MMRESLAPVLTEKRTELGYSRLHSEMTAVKRSIRFLDSFHFFADPTRLCIGGDRGRYDNTLDSPRQKIRICFLGRISRRVSEVFQWRSTFRPIVDTIRTIHVFSPMSGWPA